MAKKRNHHADKKVIELAKGKPRKEEEKFYVRFSDTQLNAILLLILADTFFVQGIVKYLEIVGKISSIRPWLVIILLSLFFLVFCVVALTISGVVSPLKIKRLANLVSFGSFILGVVLFLVSLFYIAFFI